MTKQGKTSKGLSVKKLTPKEARFVDEYLIDLNATAALKRAGYKWKNDEVARVSACRMLVKPYIASEIEARQKKLRETAGITVERVLLEVKRLAFFDTRKMFNADGSLVPITELGDDEAAAISSIEVIDKPVTSVIKYKLHSKNEALDKLCKHLGIYKELGSKENPFNVDFNITIGLGTNGQH